MANAVITLEYQDVKRRNSKLATLQHDLEHDRVLRTRIHEMLEEVTRPYVPEDTGQLKSTVRISHAGVIWGRGVSRNYAHYVWVGEVYGPNIPIKRNGEIVGWRSPRGKRKHPTGRLMNYQSPTATSYWDRVALEVERSTILERSREIIKERAREMGKYGKYYSR